MPPYVRADEQAAFKAMETAHAVVVATSKPARKAKDSMIVAPNIAAQYFMQVGSMVGVLVQIVSDLQDREQALNRQVCQLAEYIVERDATPEAYAAMAAAGVAYDVEETKRRLAEIAKKGVE